MIGWKKKHIVLTVDCSSLNTFALENYGTHIILITHIIVYQNILPKPSEYTFISLEPEACARLCDIWSLG